MTSAHAVELASQILQDNAAAIPLLRLLYAFSISPGDPLAEAMKRDVLMHVWTKTDNCEEGMITFLRAFEVNPTKRAA